MHLESTETAQERLPPCRFPILEPATGADGRRRSQEKAVLNGRWTATEESFKNHGVSLPAILKAAWVITLQSFVSSEIISFEFRDWLTPAKPKINGFAISNGIEKVHGNGHAKISNGVNGHHAPPTGGGHARNGIVIANGSIDADEEAQAGAERILCVLRFDSGESLPTFLTRMEAGQRSRFAIAPPGYDIYFVSPIPAELLCNTALVLKGLQQQDNTPDDDKLDLVLTVTKTPSGRISTTIDYADSSVDRKMARSALDTFTHVLADILTFPNLKLGEIDTCSHNDREIIKSLTENVSPLYSACVHDLIVKQCRLTPDRLAICGYEGDLTYGQLDDLSLRLAHHLVGMGVGPETFVLSCFKKSMWSIVARLAILRAGGAYISVNAQHPPAYLESVISRAKATILLTSKEYAKQFSKYVDHVVEVSHDTVTSLPANPEPACTTVRPDNACLILFTSGSTGEPKGIIQVHDSYTTAIRDYVRNLGLGPHTRFLHFDDYSFDISNLEFLVPLMIGACCCVPRPMKTLQDIIDNVNFLQANTIFLTPTVAIKLKPSDVPSLDILCVGGEPLPKDLILKWRNSKTKLINQYGMGEVAICCALNDKPDVKETAKVGRPSTGAIWVVDPSNPNRLMPPGAVGELLMEGHHLSRRYLDQMSRQTEAVFLDGPPAWLPEIHTDRVASRFYRSGDLGRMNHDGAIQYIGRKDTILKLDGCRVDALEVEHQARKCLTPKDAVVIDLLGAIDVVSDPILTAYLYLDDHPTSTAPALKGEPVLVDATKDPVAAPKVEEVKKCIAHALPSYQVPKQYLLATWIPRTASNKTDRKKLHVVGEKYNQERLALEGEKPCEAASPEVY